MIPDPLADDIWRRFVAALRPTGTLGRARTRRSAVGLSEAYATLRQVLDERVPMPETAAGRALLVALTENFWATGTMRGDEEAIDAIEAEARAAGVRMGDEIDVERLTDALFYVYGNVTKRGAAIGPDRPGPTEGYRKREFWQDDARLVADRYAALTPEKETPHA